MATKIVTVTELKAHLAEIVARMEAEPSPVYVTQHGKPKVVVVKYADYEELLGRLEDLEDALAMHQALAAPEEEAISLDEHEHRRTA
ncbi:MAG: type II toxin-antitoxin system Phd/YefM family antitoxin [Dehalococcoidia bacterium]